MFKSVFAKYVTVFMLIITVGFALLLLVVTSIMENYSATVKQNLMENTASATGVALAATVYDASPLQFPELLESTGAEQVRDLLEVFSDRDDDLAVSVMSPAGEVLYATAGSDWTSVIPEATDFSPEILQEIISSKAYTGELSGRGVEELVFTAVPVHNGEGELCGIVTVYAEKNHRGITTRELSTTVISSALLILLAAMIAVYFMTERTIAPLREMRTAARDFAAGRFESRVRVQGQDEVAELSLAFNQMAESLENLETMRNSFIANVSHDLRTPMTTIAGFIDSIRDGVIPPEERDHYLEVVSMEVHRLSRLVASLLDLSRLQAGDRKFTMKPFDICEMARLILISFEQKIEEKHLDVQFECEEDRMAVLADRDAIYQIFYNICHNAVKFSRESGTLRIRLVSTKDKKIRVSVYNDGEGIPTEDQPMIFERFYKSDKSRGLDKTGVGLGLFISKTIITAHGEKIWVSSTPGKNCEFFFTLPRAAHTPAHTQEES